MCLFPWNSLTGDGALRYTGEKEAVIIFGTIWIVDELVKFKVITINQAKEAFEMMRTNKRRLPWDLIEQKYK